MATTASPSGTAVERLSVTAFKVPPATEQESDGTLVWESTSVVVVRLEADGASGIGYTFCHPAAAHVIEGKLSATVLGADALMPQRVWARLQVEPRQLGHQAITKMAMSAVDIAPWDLKAKLLDVCLADLLPRYRESVPIYGSGGFTSYTLEQLQDQVGGCVDEGFRSVKIKVGRDKRLDMERLGVTREAVDDGAELMVDGNGAYVPKEALYWAERFRADWGVTYFEEPVSSQDVAGMRPVRERGPAGLALAANEYGWSLPDFARLIDSADVLQADVSRCGGITNLLRVDGLCKAHEKPSSAHCVPAVTAHAGCAVETLVNTEYFFDHYRIEAMLFDGRLEPAGGLLTPDRSRPGVGLMLKPDAAEYEVYRGEVS